MTAVVATAPGKTPSFTTGNLFDWEGTIVVRKSPSGEWADRWLCRRGGEADVRDGGALSFAPMLIGMTSRGPDSAGLAVSRNPVDDGRMKLTLAQDDSEIDWKSPARSFETDLACSAALKVNGNHAVLVTEAEETGSTVCLRRP